MTASENTVKDDSLKSPGMTPEIPDLCEGDYTELGRYFQENAAEKTPVSWLVLRRLPEKALLISSYALDCRPFEDWGSGKWKLSRIREWLNGAFIRETFSASERKMILPGRQGVTVNPDFFMSDRDSCRSRIFLLSLEEAKTLFHSPRDRQCRPTPYALKRGVRISSDTKFGGSGYCWWWLRSRGGAVSQAAFIDAYGMPDYAGSSITSRFLGVRPALWLRIPGITLEQGDPL